MLTKVVKKKCGTIAPYWKKVIPMVTMTEKPKEKLKKDFLLQKNLKEIGISPKDIFKATGLKEGEY